MTEISGIYENRAQITANGVLILHVLSRLGAPVTDRCLTDIIMEPGLVNYFTYTQCLFSLVESRFVERKLDTLGNVLYDITESGVSAEKSLSYMISGGLGAAYDTFIERNLKTLERKMRIETLTTEDSKGNIFVRLFPGCINEYQIGN